MLPLPVPISRLLVPTAVRIHSRSAAHLAALGHGAGRVKKKTSSGDPKIDEIISRLQKLGTGPLCDADKGHRLAASTSDDPDVQKYKGLNLMDTDLMKLRHAPDDAIPSVMVGVARTVQMSR
jgi:hypothetical protein